METAAPSIIPRNASLYVGDLQPEVTEIDLIQKFSQIAPLASVRICRDRFSFKSLRYGYVNFLHPFDGIISCLSYVLLIIDIFDGNVSLIRLVFFLFISKGTLELYFFRSNLCTLLSF